MQYLFLHSQDSLLTYPQNHPTDFTIDLPQPLQLPGKWSIALTEINIIPNKKIDLYIYCDLCEYSYQRNTCKPILRIIRGSSTFSKPYFIPVAVNYAPRIRLYIRDSKGNIPSFDISTSRCTLALRHDE